MEGKEARFGGPLSALFADATTLTSTGAVNAMHDCFTPLGGGVTLVNMMLGEVAPGGVGSGLYGMLVLAIITVFVAGLMVGRTPEYLGKKLGRREMTLVLAVHPHHPGARARRHRHRDGAPAGPRLDAQFRAARALRGAVRLHLGRQQQRLGVRRAVGEHALLQRGARAGHGCSAGSCRSSSSWPSPGGSRSRAAGRPRTAPFPTHRPLFVGLLSAVVLVVVGLTYFPALSLGPLAEGL